MNVKINASGYVKRKQLYPGNHVYFVMNGMPHTGVITSSGSECYEISGITGMFMSWDSRCMSVPKNDCVGTQEIYIPEFPDKETATWMKSMGETMLKYENFPKKQIMKYESMSNVFTQLIDFVPGDMIFQLSNGLVYELYTHKDYGDILIGMKDIVVPLWIYHKQKCDIERLVASRIALDIELPKVATEYQVLKIYCDDGVCRETRKKYIDEFTSSGNSMNVSNDYASVKKMHMQLLYKKENMKKRDVTDKEIIESVYDSHKFLSKYQLDKLLLR